MNDEKLIELLEMFSEKTQVFQIALYASVTNCNISADYDRIGLAKLKKYFNITKEELDKLFDTCLEPAILNFDKEFRKLLKEKGNDVESVIIKGER